MAHGLPVALVWLRVHRLGLLPGVAFVSALTRAKVEAYSLGVRAWQEQRPLGTNPFPAGSDEAKKWESGWKASQANSLLHEKT